MLHIQTGAAWQAVWNVTQPVCGSNRLPAQTVHSPLSRARLGLVEACVVAGAVARLGCAAFSLVLAAALGAALGCWRAAAGLVLSRSRPSGGEGQGKGSAAEQAQQGVKSVYWALHMARG
jgi:hypothetical protein